jgi:rhamnosyltransferase
VGEDFLGRLTDPIRTGAAAVAYGRQIARDGADLLERLGRAFNYPGTSQLRSLADWPSFGSYTHFCSNACAAWSNAALDAIGGFKPTLVSEETIAAAEILAQGGRIAYVAEAVVRHSHRYRLADEFRRQFDIGYSRRLYAPLLLAREPDERRGRRFARKVLAETWTEAPGRLPKVLAHLAACWLGYRVGLCGRHLPLWAAARCSGQDFFWTSEALARCRGRHAPAAA